MQRYSHHIHIERAFVLSPLHRVRCSIGTEIEDIQEKINQKFVT